MASFPLLRSFRSTTSFLVSLGVFSVVTFSQANGAEFNVLTQKAVPAPGSQLISQPLECGICTEQVRILKNELVIGEPIVLEFIIKPKPEMKERFNRNFSDDITSNIELYIQDSNGTVWQYETEENKIFQNASTVPLARGQMYRHQLILSHDTQTVSGAIFDQPGQYNVLVRMKCTDPSDSKWLEHQPLPVLINAPTTGSQDAEALRLIMSDPESFLSFQSGTIIAAEYKERLKAIAEKLPQSALHPFALYALALLEYRTYQKDGKDENLNQSYAYSEQFKNAYKHHPLTFKNLILFRESAMLKNEKAEADAAFLEVWQDPELSYYMVIPEFARLDGKQKPIPFLFTDWMIFERSSDGLYTEAELFEAYKIPPVAVEPIDLNVLIWDRL